MGSFGVGIQNQMMKVNSIWPMLVVMVVSFHLLGKMEDTVLKLLLLVRHQNHDVGLQQLKISGPFF